MRRSQLDHLAAVAAQPRGHRAGADTTTWATAWLYEIDSTRNRALVSVYGSEATWVPAVPSSYAGIGLVHVRMDASRPVLVEGPTTSAPVAAPPPSGESPPPSSTNPAPTPPPPVSSEPKYATDSFAIRPTASATWSDKWGRYGAWYGDSSGPATLYQGESAQYGSGRLVAACLYGTQVKALGAVEIISMDVTIIGSGRGTSNVWNPTVQGSGMTKLSGRPTGIGDSRSGANISASGSTRITFPEALREGFRTGQMRALRFTGPSYGGAYGTNHGQGMLLRGTYRRLA